MPYTGPRTQITLTTGAEALLEGSLEEVMAELRDANGFAVLTQTGGVPLHVRATHVIAVSPLPDA
jgi:hypothetical protein